MAEFISIAQDPDAGLVDVTARCQFCPEPAEVRGIPLEGWERWRAGAFIQNALPDMSPDDREILISGTHPACWDRAFPPEEPPDD